MAEPTYTVYVRVPIPRGDFVDPPQVNWDSAKDEALWKILSGAAQTEIDWNKVAERFDVPVDFLLKQVAFLTERHASQVRAQVRKATAAAKGGSSAASPIPGSDSAAAIRSLRKDPEGSGAGTPILSATRPIVSRNTSTSTAVIRDATNPSSPRPGKATPVGRVSDQAGRRRLSSLPITSTAKQSPPPPTDTERTQSPGPMESSSSTTSDDESSPAQSRIIRRPPRFQQSDGANAGEDDDDDDESEPAFQRYKAPASRTQTSAQDLSSTLRGERQATTRRSGKEPIHHSQTSDSDVSSPGRGQGGPRQRDPRTPGPLSPRRQSELAGRSPSTKGKGQSQDGSDGTPSMGSSFSDLDDASVTQSALEEALASHMDRGAGSRFSISQAFRSRYYPGGNS